MESYLHCVEPIRSNKRASRLEDSISSIKSSLKKELGRRPGVDKEKLSQRPTFVAFELPAALLAALGPSFGSELHELMKELILKEIKNNIADKKSRARLRRSLRKKLPRAIHWLSCRPEPLVDHGLDDNDEEGVDDASLTAGTAAPPSPCHLNIQYINTSVICLS